jgi:mannose-6-phosphate isomerase-like protein (cupin superfamily)
MHGALVLLVATFTAGVASSAAAQQPAPGELPLSNSVQILTAARLAALGDSLPAGPSSFRHIARFDGLTDMISRRDSSGVPERHEGFADIFVVQRGHARLLYGGTADGERASSPGEWRGGTIRNGTEAELKPGDVVVIPAGIPHQLLLPTGERFYYFVFKVAKHPAR